MIISSKKLVYVFISCCSSSVALQAADTNCCFPMQRPFAMTNRETLHKAAFDVDYKKVQKLLAWGISPATPGWDGQSPLHSALLSKTNSPEKENRKMLTIRTLLIYRGLKKCTKYINQPDKNGYTSLHYAALRPGPDAIFLKMLLEYGAYHSVNRRTFFGGTTPLHLAGDQMAARLLLKYGANPTIRDADGMTPVDNNPFVKDIINEADNGLTARLYKHLPLHACRDLQYAIKYEPHG